MASTAPIDVSQIAFGDLEFELNQTRKLLSVIPEDKLDYRPHPKSWSLGGLAQHVAQLPWWFAMAARSDEYDLGSWQRLNPPRSRQDVLDLFEKNAANAQAALAELDAEALIRPWTLRKGSHVMLTIPKSTSLRGFGISHMIHHRAQLTVYLRMLELPVPGLYGPSADEQ